MRYKEKDFKANKIKIKEVFPNFSHIQCFKCGDYIKKEKMWRGLYWYDIFEGFDFVFACKECCKDKEEFLEYAKRRLL